MITVRLFGMTKMLAGNQGFLSLNVANGRQVKDLVGAIETSHPEAIKIIDGRGRIWIDTTTLAAELGMTRFSFASALLPKLESDLGDRSRFRRAHG